MEILAEKPSRENVEMTMFEHENFMKKTRFFLKLTLFFVTFSIQNYSSQNFKIFIFLKILIFSKHTFLVFSRYKTTEYLLERVPSQKYSQKI